MYFPKFLLLYYIFNEYDASLKTTSIVTTERIHVFENMNVLFIVASAADTYVLTYRNRYNNASFGQVFTILAKNGCIYFVEPDDDILECTWNIYYL